MSYTLSVDSGDDLDLEIRINPQHSIWRKVLPHTSMRKLAKDISRLWRTKSPQPLASSTPKEPANSSFEVHDGNNMTGRALEHSESRPSNLQTPYSSVTGAPSCERRGTPFKCIFDVKAQENPDKTHHLRTLFDSGADTNLITREAVNASGAFVERPLPTAELHPYTGILRGAPGFTPQFCVYATLWNEYVGLYLHNICLNIVEGGEGFDVLIGGYTINQYNQNNFMQRVGSAPHGDWSEHPSKLAIRALRENEPTEGQKEADAKYRDANKANTLQGQSSSIIRGLKLGKRRTTAGSASTTGSSSINTHWSFSRQSTATSTSSFASDALQMPKRDPYTGKSDSPRDFAKGSNSKSGDGNSGTQ